MDCTNGGKFSHLIRNHPCFNNDAHSKYGRIHLPVCSECNIQCLFCKRGFNKWEKRPGVSRSLLKPSESIEKVTKAIELCPQLTVVGIAGPGDSLATDEGLETLEIVHKSFPNLIKCISTNGLLLSEKAERIVKAGVKTISVTINAVEPEILRKICSSIYYRNKLMTGLEAANTLISAQISGIKKIVSLGIAVKINTVLIPGINDSHIKQTAEVVAECGASMINIIPLIPQNSFITIKAPNCLELNAARKTAAKFLPVFHQCKHCRADAIGIPGSEIDFSDQLYDEQICTFSHG